MGGPFLSQPCRGYWVLFLLLSQDVVLDAVVPPPPPFSLYGNLVKFAFLTPIPI